MNSLPSYWIYWDHFLLSTDICFINSSLSVNKLIKSWLFFFCWICKSYSCFVCLFIKQPMNYGWLIRLLNSNCEKSIYFLLPIHMVCNTSYSQRYIALILKSVSSPLSAKHVPNHSVSYLTNVVKGYSRRHTVLLADMLSFVLFWNAMLPLLLPSSLSPLPPSFFSLCHT